MSQQTDSNAHQSIPLAERLKGMAGVFGIHVAETPHYKVAFEEGDKEVRRYAEMITVSTHVAGPLMQAREEAFLKLSDYIFGKNKTKERLSMTAPVFQEQVDRNTKMPMTAPVLQETTPEGLRMTFILPSEFKLSMAPIPEDRDVIVERMPPQIVAAIKYSGINDDDKIKEKTKELIDWATKLHLTVQSIKIAQYDGPYSIPFLRRNEILAVTKALH